MIGQCTEHIALHYIILYHDISRVPYWDWQIRDTQPLPPLTYIDYWSQADAVQSLNVVPSISVTDIVFS